MWQRAQQATPGGVNSPVRAFRSVEAQLNELDRLTERATFARKLVRDAKGEAQLAAAAKQIEEVLREVEALRGRRDTRLRDLAERARGYAEAASSANTRRAYAADWTHHAAWCRRE